MLRFRSFTLRRVLAALALAGMALPSARAALRTVRFSGIDYVDMVDACGRMGVRFSFTSKGRSMIVRSPGHSAEFEPPSDNTHRLVLLDGVRVYLGDPILERGGRMFVSQTDFDRRVFPLLRPDLFAPPPRHPRIIVIDAGHGGLDPGTTNARFHLEEKTLTLDVAKRLRPLLVAQGWSVAMIRLRDTQLASPREFRNLEELKKVDLLMRAQYAASQHADVFLSIHFDAGPTPASRGSLVLSYNPAGQHSSKSQERNNNDARQFEPGNRNDMWNFVLAHAIYRNLPRALNTTDVGERIQDVSVLRNATMPAVLVESAYLSNDAEAQRLMDPNFRERIAETIAKGLGDYRKLIDSLQLALPTVKARAQ